MSILIDIDSSKLFENVLQVIEGGLLKQSVNYDIPDLFPILVIFVILGDEFLPCTYRFDILFVFLEADVPSHKDKCYTD